MFGVLKLLLGVGPLWVSFQPAFFPCRGCPDPEEQGFRIEGLGLTLRIVV